MQDITCRQFRTTLAYRRRSSIGPILTWVPLGSVARNRRPFYKLPTVRASGTAIPALANLRRSSRARAHLRPKRTSGATQRSLHDGIPACRGLQASDLRMNHPKHSPQLMIWRETWGGWRETWGGVERV